MDSTQEQNKHHWQFSYLRRWGAMAIRDLMAATLRREFPVRARANVPTPPAAVSSWSLMSLY